MLSKERIIEKVWGFDSDAEDRPVFDSSFGVLARDWLQQAIRQTQGRTEGQMEWDGRQFLFSRTPAYAKVDSSSQNAPIEQFTQIAFLDITESRQSLLELLAAFVGVASSLCWPCWASAFGPPGGR